MSGFAAYVVAVLLALHRVPPNCSDLLAPCQFPYGPCCTCCTIGEARPYEVCNTTTNSTTLCAPHKEK